MSDHDQAAARYLEGGMTATQRAGFEAAVASEPAVAQALVAQLRMDARLRRLLGTEREQQLAADSTPHTAALVTAAASPRANAPRRETRPLRRRATRATNRRSRPRGRRLSTPWVALALVVALAVPVVGLVPWWRSPALEVVASAGGQRDAAGRVIAPGERFPLGSGARLDPTTSLVLRAHDGSTITLAPGTEFEVLAVAPGTRLRLSAGSATCAVTPQAPDAGFVVRLRHAEVAVVGTRFTVATDDRRSRLAVATGRVRFRAPGLDRVLGPGESVEVGPAVAPPAVGEPGSATGPRITGFSLVEADSGRPIPGRESVVDGVRLRHDPQHPVAIVARTAGPVERMAVTLDGRRLPPEQNPPYALMGNPRADDPDDDRAFYPLDLPPGRHRFEAVPIGPDGPGPVQSLVVEIE